MKISVKTIGYSGGQLTGSLAQDTIPTKVALPLTFFINGPKNKQKYAMDMLKQGDINGESGDGQFPHPLPVPHLRPTEIGKFFEIVT